FILPAETNPGSQWDRPGVFTKNLICFCYVCQHGIFQICTVPPDILDNRFNHCIGWYSYQNTDKTGDISCSKHDSNYSQGMQCKRLPHYIWSNEVTFNLLGNQCNNRYPDKHNRILNQCKQSSRNKCDPRTDERHYIHKQSKDCKQQCIIQADNCIADV